ncbi:recombinase family protein [Dietzia natronolimnaea]|uniref:recombinase family protein n=1 Tax=Dietzia natronolimnaea TaxID=161920 RepID=UPI0015FE3287|nr:recombinase family protein [Dietzia natronolimnaea]MBB1037342.1 recombinase family protein [Dietzia natronolimnaea]
MIRVACYFRISEDPKRTGLGVARQRDDCLKLCERNGFEIVAEYTDNDRSAFKDNARRPGYDQLLDDIRHRRIDAVVAYKDDRLGRRLRTLIDLYDLLLEHGVVVHLVSGTVDLRTSQGIAMAQMAAVMAENYVRSARENNLRARRQIAEAGKRHCSVRPYGWEPGGMKIRSDEAEVVREIVRRVIFGETPTSIALSLNERDIPTVRGARWTGIGVRKCAARASNAAIREHNGKMYYNGVWEPIITQDEYAQVQTVLNREAKRFARGTGRKYLLTGLVFCGECGNRLSATVGSGGRKPAYRCHKARSDDNTIIGCGGVSRNIAALELLVQKAVLARLNSSELLDALTTRKNADMAAGELLAKRDEQAARVDQLVTDYATGVLSADQFRQAKQVAEQRLGELNQQVSRLTANTALAKIDLGADLEKAWESNPLAWRRELVELLIDRVEVLPYPDGYPRKYWHGFKFAPELVRVKWRV